jgi:hypothetical protein
VRWSQTVPGACFLHGFFVPTTAEVPTVPPNVLVRALCHVIVNNVPESGLPELLRSASDVYEFHVEEPWEASRPLLSETKTVDAKVRGQYERPSFQVAEE